MTWQLGLDDLCPGERALAYWPLAGVNSDDQNVAPFRSRGEWRLERRAIVRDMPQFQRLGRVLAYSPWLLCFAK